MFLPFNLNLEGLEKKRKFFVIEGAFDCERTIYKFIHQYTYF